MTINYFIMNLVKSIVNKGGVLMTDNYSIGKYETVDKTDYAVITRVGGNNENFDSFSEAFYYFRKRVTKVELINSIDKSIGKLEDLNII